MSILSYSARYFLVGPGYRVLRRWKVRHGPAFDRRVLGPIPESILQTWSRTNAAAVIPVPQRTNRAWRLGGSPAEKIALWVSRQAGLPLVRALAPAPWMPGQRGRQAELRLQERVANSIRFSGTAESERVLGKTVILVDDFMTSGRTLRGAAESLTQEAGIRATHLFCLGARPQFNAEARPT